MNEIAEERKERKRKPRVPASSSGEQLVIAELLRRGFAARWRTSVPGNAACSLESAPRRSSFESGPCIRPHGTSAKQVLLGAVLDQVTVYVLLGVERSVKSARFFVVKNSDLAAQFRQPSDWKAFGFIDAKTVEKYENNWDILR